MAAAGEAAHGRGRQHMAKVGDVFQVFINTVTIKVAGADNGGASRSGLDPATQLPDINRIAAKYQLEIVGPPLE
jgi:hypothetical protein